jgi:hypothetical protein
MGIPKFRSFLRQSFPDCFQVLPHGSRYEVVALESGRQFMKIHIITISCRGMFDSVYFDLNAILHPESNLAKSRQHFVRRLYARMNHYLNHVAVPRHLVYIAIDGSAPWAKTWIQRSRREAVCPKNMRMDFLSLITNSCLLMMDRASRKKQSLRIWRRVWKMQSRRESRMMSRVVKTTRCP